MYFEWNKERSVCLLQRWRSILLQMTTLGPALKGRSGWLWVCSCESSADGRCALHGWVFISNRGNVKEVLRTPSKVVIIFFFFFFFSEHLIRSPSQVQLCAPTYCSVLSSVVIMEFRGKNLVPFSSATGLKSSALWDVRGSVRRFILGEMGRKRGEETALWSSCFSDVNQLTYYIG